MTGESEEVNMLVGWGDGPRYREWMERAGRCGSPAKCDKARGLASGRCTQSRSPTVAAAARAPYPSKG